MGDGAGMATAVKNVDRYVEAAGGKIIKKAVDDAAKTATGEAIKQVGGLITGNQMTRKFVAALGGGQTLSPQS